MVDWDLPAFVAAHTERGECKCGLCIDRGDKRDPTGHTVDIAFFKVALRADESREALAETFRQLTAEQKGEFSECDPFDGQQHNYLELGAWLGSQGLALQYMALGALIDVFRLITPRTLFGEAATESQVQQMAGHGFVMVRAAKSDR